MTSFRDRLPNLTLLCLGLLLIWILGNYFLLFLAAIAGNPPAPHHSDELIYFLNTRSFFETGSLATGILLGGNESPIGGFDTHGFAYTLLHGLIAKLFGFHPWNAYWINLAFLLLTLLILLRQNWMWIQRLGVMCLILLYFIVPIFLFSYMQETLQLLFAVVLTLLLVALYQPDAADRKKHQLTGMFLLMVLAVSLFRPTWILWSVGLLPLARSQKQGLVYTLLILLCALFITLYLKFFTAPYAYGYPTTAFNMILTQGLNGLIQLITTHGMENLRHFLTDKAYYDFYVSSNYLIAVLTLFFLVYGLMRKSRLALSAALISLVTIGVQFIFYDIADWRGPRYFAPLYYAFAIVMINENIRALPYLMIVFLLTLFPGAVSLSKTWMLANHKKTSTCQTNLLSSGHDIRRTLFTVSDTDTVLVLVSNKLWIKPLLLSLPFKTQSGVPIRYIFNPEGKDLDIPNPEPVDYILLSTQDAVYGTETLFRDKTVTLYRTTDLPLKDLLNQQKQET